MAANEKQTTRSNYYFAFEVRKLSVSIPAIVVPDDTNVHPGSFPALLHVELRPHGRQSRHFYV